jgi:hypothetical protein
VLTTKIRPSETSYRLSDLIDLHGLINRVEVVSSSLFSRVRGELRDGATLIYDQFPGADDAACAFVRIPVKGPGVVWFVVEGAYEVTSCAAGGWLLEARRKGERSYWFPQPPALRAFDAHGRIVREEAPRIADFRASDGDLAVSITTAPGLALDLTFWSIPSQGVGLCEELKQLSNLERTRVFLWSSQAAYQSPASLYRYLINGSVYQDALAWPRKWRFCCELDAYELFNWLTGLERSTRKSLYNLLRRQVLLSVVSRQSADGGWYHGEWTDMNESHYRFHNGALLLLENALHEWSDGFLWTALRRGVEFVAAKADKTDLGLWFLHDSLEASAELLDEMHRQTGAIAKGHGAWRPSRMLGKSLTNKLILNSHLDTTIVLDRYRELSGDQRFVGHVDSARAATRALLARKPADLIYRAIYGMVRLTLLPEAEARRLPLPVRAFKRLTSLYLIPNLYRLKRLAPRIVMPGGFVDRHLSMLHFDAKYHAVNMMDLVRHLRRFPNDGVDEVLDGAIEFVMGNRRRTLRWWGEAKPRQFAIVVFAEAMFQLCLLRPSPAHRSHLAESLLLIDDLGLGVPPSLLGGNAEATPLQSRVACPTPASRRLLVANLSRDGHPEILLINPSSEAIELAWDAVPPNDLVWINEDAGVVIGGHTPECVPPRSWLLGRQESA